MTPTAREITVGRRGLHERIAERLGWVVDRHVAVVLSNGKSDFMDRWMHPENGTRWEPPDYDRDESANALLLEAMRPVKLHLDELGRSYVQRGPLAHAVTYEWTDGNDRKTAIVNAFAKWKGIE